MNYLICGHTIHWTHIRVVTNCKYCCADESEFIWDQDNAFCLDFTTHTDQRLIDQKYLCVKDDERPLLLLVGEVHFWDIFYRDFSFIACKYDFVFVCHQWDRFEMEINYFFLLFYSMNYFVFSLVFSLTNIFFLILMYMAIYYKALKNEHHIKKKAIYGRI